jgi:hypothetical protein
MNIEQIGCRGFGGSRAPRLSLGPRSADLRGEESDDN